MSKQGEEYKDKLLDDMLALGLVAFSATNEQQVDTVKHELENLISKYNDANALEAQNHMDDAVEYLLGPLKKQYTKVFYTIHIGFFQKKQQIEFDYAITDEEIVEYFDERYPNNKITWHK